MVFQRRFNVEQGSGDIEQRGLIRRALALCDQCDHIALLHHDPPRNTQSEHAQGVAHPVQHVDLARQFRRL
ncbi:MAG: hypothetical protein ACOVKS_12880, partial [Aquimonas sp.]